ncbi:MAG TPA: hypothetical protein VK668_20470 [Mucilaginibacter sp.]|nr:hypothetical protein [Mucilaginibacter sp.]
MKSLIIIILASFVFLAACNRAPDNAGGDASSTGTSGGSHPVDSIKAIGSGVNGQSANTPATTDTVTPGHSVAAPKNDSLNRKKP